MSCPRCGTVNPDEAKFCAKCGNPLSADRPGQSVLDPGTPGSGPPPESGAPFRETPRTSGKAIASLVCGILGFVFLGSIAAIILGHMALSEIRKSAGRLVGSGMATAGLVLGYIGIAIIPVILIVAAIAIPNLLRAKMAADEASAVGTLRVINTGAAAYSAEFQNGFPASLDVLGDDPGGSVNCNHAGLVDANLIKSRQKHGYVFRYTPKFPDSIAPAVSADAQAKGCTSAGASGFEVTADPIQQNSSGARNFFTDQSGVIRYSINATANADSAPIR